MFSLAYCYIYIYIYAYFYHLLIYSLALVAIRNPREDFIYYKYLTVI